MAESQTQQPKMGKLGCGAIVLAVVGLVVGLGLYLGKRDADSKTPCERYAEVMARALDHCYSGVNRSPRHHIDICERSVDPTPACLETMKSLKCDQLELGPTVAGDVCRKKP